MARRVMVLSDGDLPSLTACTAAAEAAIGKTAAADRPVVLPFPSRLAIAPGRMDAIARQAEVLVLSVLPAPSPTPETADGESEVHDLVSGAYAAVRAGIDTVWWPLSVSALDRMGEAADRALLVSRLVALDDSRTGVPSVRIETPYLDLGDEQLAELALDLGVPLETVWWWADGGGEAAAARARWMPALAKVGWVVGDRAKQR